MIKNKTFLQAILLLGCFSFLFANGSHDVEEEQKVSIRILSYQHSGSHDFPIYNEYIQKFEKENPQAIIEHEGLESSDARTKLAVEMAGGTPPDIAFMVQGVAREYADQGLLMDLADAIHSDPEWKVTYYPAALESVTWDGEIFLVPSHAHYGGMYYNPAILKEAGFDRPAATWDELLEQGKALKNIGKSAFMTNGKGFRYAWVMSQIMVRTIGVDKMNSLYNGDLKTSWDDPETGFIEALKKLEELVESGGFPKDVNGIDGPVSALLWGDGQAAYWYEGTWQVNSFKSQISEEFRDSLKWTTFPVINGADGDQQGGVGGPLLGWGVSGKITDPLKKELVLKYVKGVESQEMATRHIVENSQPTGSIPDNGKTQDLHPLLKSILTGYAQIEKVAYPTDVAAPSPVDNAIKKIAVPGIIDGTLSSEEAAKEVNLRAIEFWSK